MGDLLVDSPAPRSTLAFQQRASIEYRQEIRKNLKGALDRRDQPFGDFRTKGEA